MCAHVSEGALERRLCDIHRQTDRQTDRQTTVAIFVAGATSMKAKAVPAVAPAFSNARAKAATECSHAWSGSAPVTASLGFGVWYSVVGLIALEGLLGFSFPFYPFYPYNTEYHNGSYFSGLI